MFSLTAQCVLWLSSRRPMARPAPDLLAPRIAPASRLTSFGGYRPANVLALAFASGWFVHCTNHRQAAVTSGASRLSGLCASLRPSFGAATALRPKTHAAETPPTASTRSVADWERRHLGGVVILHLQRGKSAALPIKMRLIWARRFRYNTLISRGGMRDAGS